MKRFKLALLLALFAVPSIAADFRTGEELVAAMHKKYYGKLYTTLTFVQKTVHHQPDGATSSEIWHEAMTCPGKLRIDFADSKTGDGILFADGKIVTFKDGKGSPARPFVHPLMVLGFDVYCQDPATTIAQVKGLGIDMGSIHREKWHGKEVYVVGAKQGDVTTPQFWIDKKTLLFVRLIQAAGRDKTSIAETQFNKYLKAKGGWVAAEVLFFVTGKPTTSEIYSDIQADITLHPDLWDREKWFTADKTYYQKKR
jgi:hypothetical protein